MLLLHAAVIFTSFSFCRDLLIPVALSLLLEQCRSRRRPRLLDGGEQKHHRLVFPQIWPQQQKKKEKTAAAVLEKECELFPDD
jgi:hypothetical protein